MSDIRDWGAFIRGRWDWTRGGYEAGFHGCQFTDIDAAIEFDGRQLVIEAKHYDGVGDLPSPPSMGQRLWLRNEVTLGKTVFVVYGCGPCNDPQALRIYSAQRDGDRFIDWRKLPKEERRQQFKAYIDDAMGVRPLDSDSDQTA